MIMEDTHINKKDLAFDLVKEYLEIGEYFNFENREISNQEHLELSLRRNRIIKALKFEVLK